MTQNYIKTIVKLPNNEESNLFTYVPVAGYTNPGIMAFNENHFTINTDTHVVSLNATFYGQYALKSVTITGAGYLIGGGDLSMSRSIDINTETKSKIDNALQSLSVPSYMNYIKTGTNASISLKLEPQTSLGYEGYLEIKSDGPSDGLYVNLKDAGIIDGSVSEYNQILTKSVLDATYGSLDSFNRWEGSNIFNSTVEIFSSRFETDVETCYINSDTTTISSRLGYCTFNGCTARYSSGVSPTDNQDLTTKSYVDTKVSDAISSVFKPAGSVTFTQLLQITPSVSTLGNMYNVEDAFTTTSAFIEGAGLEYPAGTDVGIIERNGQYYYDTYAGQIDLSGYYTKPEVNSRLDSKVDKITGTQEHPRAYIVNTSGVQTSISVCVIPRSWSLVYRDQYSNSEFGEPVLLTHAATKNYVDTNLTTKLNISDYATSAEMEEILAVLS